MKVAIQVVFTIAAVVAFVAFVENKRNQAHQTILEQSAIRINEAVSRTRADALDAAESLLLQVDIDLSSIEDDKWLARRAALSAAEKLRSEEKVARSKLATAQAAKRAADQVKQQVGARMVAALQQAVSLTTHGEFQTAKQVVTQLSSSPYHQESIAPILDFIDRMAAEDFPNAEIKLGAVPGTLPDGSSSVEFKQILEKALQERRQANKTAQGSIAQQIKDIIDSAQSSREVSSRSDTFELLGRAMVWDFTKDEVEKAYELLPDDLRASSRDGIITMFCIMKRTNVEVGRYMISGQPAYKEKMEIAVVHWPARRYLGANTIWGGSPPSVRRVKSTPEYGSSVQIKEWIEKLPRDTSRGSAELSASVAQTRSVPQNPPSPRPVSEPNIVPAKAKPPVSRPAPPRSPFPAVPEATRAVDDPVAPVSKKRSWTSAGGNFSIDAEFISMGNGVVKLRKPDGSEITVSIEKLSNADKQWLADYRRSK